jgi:hypothetical protein
MVWFLERGPELIVCEARQATDGRAVELSTTAEQAGDEHVERFPTPTAMIERLVEYQRQLHNSGWHIVPDARRLERLLELLIDREGDVPETAFALDLENERLTRLDCRDGGAKSREVLHVGAVDAIDDIPRPQAPLL